MTLRVKLVQVVRGRPFSRYEGTPEYDQVRDPAHLRCNSMLSLLEACLLLSFPSHSDPFMLLVLLLRCLFPVLIPSMLAW